jgi:CheY-like chemotaxis protein
MVVKYNLQTRAKKDKNFLASNEELDFTEVKDKKLSKLNILIADDDYFSKELITIFIKPFVNEILNVYTGTDAVKACLDNPDIDLVLMDIKMPHMDGYEATREIRKFNSKVVIIAQSAYGFRDDWGNAIAAGCNDYISKPISQDDFSRMVHKHFKNR